MKYLNTITSALVVLVGSQACAAADNSGLAQIVSDSTEQQHIIDTAKRSNVATATGCPTQKFSITGDAVVYTAPVFDAGNTLTQGLWKQSVIASGCGKDRTFNVLVHVNPQSKLLDMAALLPGETRASPALQKDALGFAVTAAKLPEKDCNTGYIADTVFVKYGDKPMKGTKDKPWDETWKLVACTYDADVTMHFIPDLTGTAVLTHPEETKFTPIAPKP